jgi:hypothetical protein
MKNLIVTFLFVCGFTQVYSQIIVDSIGNVGIGTSPNSTLYSKFSVGNTGNTGAFVSFYSDTTACRIGMRYIHHDPNNTSGAYSKGIAVMNTISNGEFNIGVEGRASASSALGSGRAIGVQGLSGNSTSGYNYGVFGTLVGIQNGAGIFGTTTNSTGVSVGGRYAGYFDGDTYVSGTLTATSVYTPSDIRLKENVVSLSSNESSDSSLEKLLNINVIKYNLININKDNSDTAKTNVAKVQSVINSSKNYYGFSAQELQKIYPDLVAEGQNGYLAVNYIEMVPILVRSIQELKAEINELTSNSSGSSANAKTVSSISSTEVASNVLYQNDPNPFSENTKISFSLQESVKSAVLIIYDMNGKQIESYPVKDRGNSSITIDKNNLYPGMYIYTLIADGKSIDTKRMILTN